MLKFMDLPGSGSTWICMIIDWWRDTSLLPLSISRCPETPGPVTTASWTLRIARAAIGMVPEYLLRRLATQYRDGHAQWLAQQIDEAGVSSAEAAWLNLPLVRPKRAA